MTDKPLYKRTSPMKLFTVHERPDRFLIVGPSFHWTALHNQPKADVEALCNLLNHAALMGWQECHTTMMTASKNVN